MDNNEESVAAILGLVLLQQENHTVRVPSELLESGLPDDSGVQVYFEEESDSLVVRIAKHDEQDS